METLKDLWNSSCIAANIPSLSISTCARILAVLYVHGNNEEFVYNKSFLSDIEYITNRFNISGGETPDAEFVDKLKVYVNELEEYIEKHKNDPIGNAIFKSHIPDWATDLFKSRYNIKLIN